MKKISFRNLISANKISSYKFKFMYVVIRKKKKKTEIQPKLRANSRKGYSDGNFFFFKNEFFHDHHVRAKNMLAPD